ncbi:hypothetical protein Trydic_g5862 [Trypoxylus dichotomus]
MSYWMMTQHELNAKVVKALHVSQKAISVRLPPMGNINRPAALATVIACRSGAAKIACFGTRRFSPERNPINTSGYSLEKLLGGASQEKQSALRDANLNAIGGGVLVGFFGRSGFDPRGSPLRCFGICEIVI